MKKLALAARVAERYLEKTALPQSDQDEMAEESSISRPTPMAGEEPSPFDEHLAVAPPGWENTVKKMKKHDEIDNPWALAWHMKNKGDEPGGK